MDPDSQISIIILILLIAGAAYLALAETAIATVSKTKIKVAAERDDARAVKLLYVLDHFEDAVTTLLILNDLCHLIAAAVLTAFVTRTWGMSMVTLSTIVLTILLFFLGEMLPKSIGKKTAEKSALSCGGVIFVLMKILAPASKLLSAIGKIVIRHTKGEEELSVTEDEIIDIIEDMTEEGTIEEEEGDIITSALQFGDTRVGSVITTRNRIVGIDINDSPEEILTQIKNESHSRLLVYNESVDYVIGMLQIRKFLKAYISENENAGASADVGDGMNDDVSVGSESKISAEIIYREKIIPDIRSLVDPVYFADQNVEVDDLLENMSAKQLYMAVIRSKKGRTLGIVTVEDLVEEIFGEIYDESDHVPMSERTVAGSDTYETESDGATKNRFENMDEDQSDGLPAEGRFI